MGYLGFLFCYFFVIWLIKFSLEGNIKIVDFTPRAGEVGSIGKGFGEISELVC